MKYASLIFSALRERLGRTVLILLSTAVAFLLLGVMETVSYALSHPTPAFGSDLLVVTNKTSLSSPLPYAYLNTIASMPEASLVSTEDTIGAYYREPTQPVFAEMMDPAAYFAMNRDHLSITPEQLKAMQETRTGAIIGPTIAAKYGWKVGDVVTLHTNGNYIQQNGSVDWAFNIIGIAKISDGDNLAEYGNRFLVQYAYVDAARAVNKSRVGMFVVKPSPSVSTDTLANLIDTRFANSSFETKTLPLRDFFLMLLKQLGDIGLIINAITAAVLATLAFMTANAMMHTFHERTPDFAVLKAIGFSDRLVALLIVVESLVICGIGAAVGIGGAFLLLPMLRQVIHRVDLSPVALLPGVATALVLAIVVALLPALRAQRLQIVDALVSKA
jgi:putative ABC transport system permease protein